MRSFSAKARSINSEARGVNLQDERSDAARNRIQTFSSINSLLGERVHLRGKVSVYYKSLSEQLNYFCSRLVAVILTQHLI